MSGKPSFFAELKRRHVYRVAVAYGIAGWVLIQVASTLTPLLNLPEWSARLITLFILIGFPIALILAWAFEMTPDGIRRTEPAHSPEARPEEHTHQVGKRLNTIIIVVLALAVGGLLIERTLTRKQQPASATAAAPAATAAPAKSIAVLPFQNLSEDKSNEYFASGVQDEILTRLAGIRDLKVISRTSTERYKSQPENLKTVAMELGVATILEGSVQKAGDQVHINVQLIEAATDQHLWAQSYDRDIKDIFAVEREVAQTIADALKAQLTPQESAQVATVPTSNPAAYDVYLRALVHFNRAHDQDVLVATEIPRAIELFEQALAADPAFALAAAMLSNSHMRMYYYAPDRSQARLDSAKAAAERALALKPGLGEAHLALAMYQYWGHRDYAASTEQLRLARQELPNSADVEGQAAAIARRQGRWDEAIAGFQKATLLDPRSSFGLDQLGLSYQGLRRYEEADRAFERSVTVAPDVLDERVTHGTNSMLWKGDPAPLRAALGSLVPGSDAQSANVLSGWWLAWLSRDFAAASKAVASDTVEAWLDISNLAIPRELYVAWTHEAQGDAAQARTAFSRVQKSALAELSQRPESAELHVALGLAAAGLGLKDEALREGRRAAELLPTSRDVLSGGGVLVRVAQIEMSVGDRDAAFEHLRQLLKLPSGGYISAATLKLDPIWDPLRKDPRFAELVALGEGPVVVAKP